MIGVDFFERVAALQREGQPFAVATVVGRRAPVSAHLGDRAIVFGDGRMDGFIGGACSREIVRQQALAALKTRYGRLVSIRPGAAVASESTPEHVIVPMTCVSEGAVDVYIDPFVPPRRLVVVGATPVAEALARQARSMDYDVVRVVDAHERHDIEQQAASLGVIVVTLDEFEPVLKAGDPDQAAVVASQGHYDEQALESILKCPVAYVGLVASRTRGESIRSFLAERGAPGVERIRNPAGLDLGARMASEVALSILAEIVQMAPRGAGSEKGTTAATAAEESAAERAVDPVCGMSVEIRTAHHTAEVGGTAYYFCCAACQRKFLDNPEQYRAHAS